jgi:hypothetical protein
MNQSKLETLASFIGRMLKPGKPAPKRQSFDEYRKQRKRK